MATRPARKWRRRLLWVLASTPIVVLALWIAIHKVRWLGPLLADAARAVLGPAAVAKMEEIAYGAQDRVNQATRQNEAPQPYWTVDTAAPPAPTVTAKPGEPPAFRPADVGPVIPRYAAPGDGVWVPVVDTRHPEEPALLYKTLLHPDKKRPWTAVVMVAVDLPRVGLHLVAGTKEPEAEVEAAKSYERKAIIPAEKQDVLLAAFNGGFKATHGHWGMKIDGVTLLKPRPDGCSIAMYQDGSMAIRPWKAIADTEDRMAWYRQTPPCFIDQGKMNPILGDEETTAWGAAVGGDTVIRRSAMGLSQDGKVLYVAIGDAASAPVIASAMKHVGAHAAAQLDVNWSFPRFLLYAPRAPDSKDLVARALCKGFEFTEDEYVREKSPRDFFYLTRR